MKRQVLVDTGPLVAIFSQRDNAHESCITTLEQLSPPLITTWPVLTETAHFIRSYPGAVLNLLNSTLNGLFDVKELGPAATSWMLNYLKKYQDRKVSLADASLVYLAELNDLDTVFTLDRKDFLIYRTLTNRRLQIVP